MRLNVGNANPSPGRGFLLLRTEPVVEFLHKIGSYPGILGRVEVRGAGDGS